MRQPESGPCRGPIGPPRRRRAAFRSAADDGPNGASKRTPCRSGAPRQLGLPRVAEAPAPPRRSTGRPRSRRSFRLIAAHAARSPWSREASGMPPAAAALTRSPPLRARLLTVRAKLWCARGATHRGRVGAAAAAASRVPLSRATGKGPLVRDRRWPPEIADEQDEGKDAGRRERQQPKAIDAGEGDEHSRGCATGDDTYPVARVRVAPALAGPREGGPGVSETTHEPTLSPSGRVRTAGGRGGERPQRAAPSLRCSASPSVARWSAR